MNIEETKEAIRVMQAFVDGKTIQWRHNGDEVWEDMNPALAQTLSWNWWKNDYRIKPKPHYRPFKSAEEVMEAIKEHGDWVRRKDTSSLHRIVRLNSNELAVIDITIYGGVESEGYKSFTDCYNSGYTFADGTPFGVMEE